MGGRLGVESVVDQGSVFWIELPLVANPIHQLRSTGGLTAIAEVQSGTARTVLYIEDNISNVQLVEQILSRRPALQLLVASTGQQGWELLRSRPPDLLLLDLNLPDMHGLDMLKQIKADPQLQALPVVVVSADATARQVEQLLAAGAHAYLTKPLNISEFLRVIDASLVERPLGGPLQAAL
jgi:CheY-like chemotaxis protein